MILVKNRKAFFNYAITERFEAGIVLYGWEVKSIKEGNVSLSESFIHIEKDEAWLHQMHISAWGQVEDEAALTRRRKLLLHSKEIKTLEENQKIKGIGVIPIALHEKKGKIKLELGIGKGRKKYDKRQKLIEQEFKKAEKGQEYW